MSNRIKKISASLVMAGLVLAPVAASAATQSTNTTINALIGSSISVSTSTTVNISVTPVAGGAQTSASDTVTIATNNSTGYDLTLSDADATTTLVSGANTISASANTYASPAALANNSWGYHVDSLGTFGTGGAVETNVTTSAIKYAGVPVLASPQNIKTSSTIAAGDVVTVWYGVKADQSKPNGTYTDIVTYTGTTKP